MRNLRRGRPFSGMRTRLTATGKLKLLLAASVCGLSLLAIARAAQSLPDRDPVIVLGTLTCTVGGEAQSANPAAQGRDVICHFRPGSDGAEEVYVGTMQGVGQAKTVFGRGAVMLAVKVPAST